MEGKKATDEDLKRLYRTSEGAYLSALKFYKYLRSVGYTNSIKDVTEWVKRQTTAQVNAPVPKTKQFNTIWAHYPGDRYQMDIMVFKTFAYDGYQYILVVIDIYTRYLGLWPMKSRHAQNYTTGFKKLCAGHFIRDGRKTWPHSVELDREFKDAGFKAKCDKHNVKIYYSEPNQPNKNAVVERVIRTIRMYMGRWRFEEDNANWPEALEGITNTYNITYHKTLKKTPKEIWEGWPKVMNTQVRKYVSVKHFVGERVRIIKRADTHNPFRKSGESRLTHQIYIVTKQDGYSWEVKNAVPPHDIPSHPDGKPKKFLDYELVSISTPEEGRHYEDPSSIRAQIAENKIKGGVRREDILGSEDDPYVLVLHQGGVIRPPQVETRGQLWEKYRGGIQIVTPTPYENDRQDFAIHNPDDPFTPEDEYNLTDHHWKPFEGPRPPPTPVAPNEPVETFVFTNRPEREQPAHLVRNRGEHNRAAQTPEHPAVQQFTQFASQHGQTRGIIARRRAQREAAEAERKRRYDKDKEKV